MTGINTEHTETLARLGLSQKPEEQKASDVLGQQDFFKLLTAQMNNQTLDSAENTDFIAQMAQFGMLDGIQRLEKSFESQGEVIQSNYALQASALVGRSVMTETSQGELVSGKGISGAVDVPASVADMKVSILDSKGQLVKQIDAGTMSKGLQNFFWDGRNQAGEPMPPGNYQIKAEATISGEKTALSTQVSSKIESVKIDGASVYVNLSGVKEDIPLSKIKEFN